MTSKYLRWSVKICYLNWQDDTRSIPFLVEYEWQAKIHVGVEMYRSIWNAPFFKCFIWYFDYLLSYSYWSLPSISVVDIGNHNRRHCIVLNYFYLFFLIIFLFSILYVKLIMIWNIVKPYIIWISYLLNSVFEKLLKFD